MSTFQIVGLALSGAFAAYVLRSILQRRLSWASGGGWLLLWMSAGIAIARPELTVAGARAVGIARGADLVFYCAILAMFVGFFAVFARMRRLEGALTVLVRDLAIRAAHEQPERHPGPHA